MVALDADAVDRDDVTCFKMNDIANLEPIWVEFNQLLVAHDINQFAITLFLGAKHEFSFLAPIDDGRKSGNDEDGQVNGGTIKPSRCIVRGICANVLKD